MLEIGLEELGTPARRRPVALDQGGPTGAIEAPGQPQGGAGGGQQAVRRRLDQRAGDEYGLQREHPVGPRGGDGDGRGAEQHQRLQLRGRSAARASWV